MNTSAESTATASVKSSLSEAGSHLKHAASAANATFKQAASAAGGEWKIGREHIKSALADGARSGKSAFASGGAAAKEQLTALRGKTHEAYEGAKELAKQRPLLAIGAAFVAGYAVARLVRVIDRRA